MRSPWLQGHERGMIAGRLELDGQRMRILFVENHAVFAKTVTDLFLWDHEVLVVATLAAARQQVADRFDVVLIDYDLDDGKGDQLVSELTTAQTRPRIIGVSARPDGNAALLQAGADAVCSKREFAAIRTGQEPVSRDESPKVFVPSGLGKRERHGIRRFTTEITVSAPRRHGEF